MSLADLRSLGLAALLLLAATVFLFWPAPLHMADRVFETPGALQADSYLITWVLAWDVHALTTDPLGLFDANIYYPARGVLAGSEHMLGHLPLFGPAYLLTGNPVLAIQLTRLLTVLFCGVAMYALLRQWRVAPGPALFGGFVYALCPTRYLTVHALQLVAAPYLPLVLLFFDRTLARGRWRDSAALAICLALQMLCSFYLAYITAVALAVHAVVRAVQNTREVRLHWLPLLSGLGVAGAVFLLTSLPYASRSGIPAHGVDLLESFSASPLATYVTRPQFDRFARLGMAYVGVLPGLFAVCAVVAAWRDSPRRREIVVAAALCVAMYVLALGPTLRIGDLGVPLPYRLLSAVVPGFESMRVPLRFTFGFVLGFAALAGIGCGVAIRWLGLDARGRAAPLLVAVAIGVTALDFGHFEYRARLRPMATAADLPEVYGRLGALDEGVVVELPTAILGEAGFAALDREAIYAYNSVFHWYPLINGYTGYPPRSAALLKRIANLLPDRRALALLRRTTGVDYVVVHLDQLDESAAERWTRLADWTLIGRYGDDLLFSVADDQAADLLPAVTRGPTAGTTILGNPAGALDAAGQRARIEVVESGEPPSAVAGFFLPYRLEVENRSKRVWPVLTGESEQPVEIEYRWLKGGGEVRSGRLALPYDLTPGEQITVSGAVVAPATAGSYDLQWAIAQGERRFAEPAMQRSVEVRSLGD